MYVNECVRSCVYAGVATCARVYMGECVSVSICKCISVEVRDRASRPLQGRHPDYLCNYHLG